MTDDILKATDEKFCIKCGSMINFNIDICPKCGAQLSTLGEPLVNKPTNGKSKLIATILALLLGGIGVHKLYLGKAWIGTVYLIFFWTFIPAIIGFIEGVLLIFMSESDFNRKYNTVAPPIQSKIIDVNTNPPLTQVISTNIVDELNKLAELHQSGHLDVHEFTYAKQRLFSESRLSAQTNPEVEIETVDTSSALGKTYESSRFSSGNFFFPDSLTLASDGIIYRKGAIIGSTEEHINYRAVASFRVKNGFLLSDVSIETTGGNQPIFINGLWSDDASEIHKSIRAFKRLR